MTDEQRVIAVLVNFAVCIGVGHFLLAAPWWATVMWLSLENGVVALRPRR